MTSSPEAMGREFGDFEKDVSWDLTLGGQSSWGYGCAARLLGQLVEILDSGSGSPEVSWDLDSWRGQSSWGLRMRSAFIASESWDLTLGRASSAGVGCGWCRNSQHSKNCVSLSPRVEKLKFKKWINVFVPEQQRVVSVSRNSLQLAMLQTLFHCVSFTYHDTTKTQISQKIRSNDEMKQNINRDLGKVINIGMKNRIPIKK